MGLIHGTYCNNNYFIGYPNMATQYRNIPRAPVPAGQQAALARNTMVDRNARPISTAQQQMPGAVSAGVRVPGARGTGAGYKYTANMRNPPGQAQGMGQAQPGQPTAPVQAAVHVHGQEPLTATMLATAKPEDQKQMLGERLFPLIQVKFKTKFEVFLLDKLNFFTANVS